MCEVRTDIDNRPSNSKTIGRDEKLSATWLCGDNHDSNSTSMDCGYQLEKSLTHSQPLPTPSFQRLTLPSPQLTARMFPASDQLTRQTASGKCGSFELGSFGSKAVEVQGDEGDGRVWIKTVRS